MSKSQAANPRPEANYKEKAIRTWRQSILKRMFFATIPALAIVAILELALRAVGFHYNPHDLHRKIFDARDGMLQTSTFFTSNPLFTPSTFCLRQRFPQHKPADTLRIAMVNGSSVFLLGDAAPLRRQLEVQLRRPVEIVNMGVLGCGSERALWSTEEACGLEADLILVYCGHNEFTSFSNPHTFHDLPIGLWWLPRRSRTFQLAWRLADTRREPVKLPDPGTISLRGHPYTDAEKEQIYNQFRQNLDLLIDTARKHHMRVVLGTVPNNMRVPPAFAWLPDGTASPQTKHRAAELDQMPDDRLDALAAGPRGNAWAGHVLGMRRLSAGATSEAVDYIETSYLKDPCPLQSNRRINQIIRDVAAERHVALADVESAIKAAAKDGLPGFDLFRDNCHLNDRGNAILLSTFAAAIARLYEDGKNSQ